MTPERAMVLFHKNRDCWAAIAAESEAEKAEAVREMVFVLGKLSESWAKQHAGWHGNPYQTELGQIVFMARELLSKHKREDK